MLKWLRHRDQLKYAFPIEASCGNTHWRCRWGTGTCAEAARAGHLDLLKWMRHCDRELEMDDPDRIDYDAILDRFSRWEPDETMPHPDYLRWMDLRLWGGRCPWNESTCIAAAANGYLHILQWLRSPERDAVRPDGVSIWGGRCPWSEDECLELAKKYKHVAMAKWIESGAGR